MDQNNLFYTNISKIRDIFHKSGTFDDSNSKLDEISKYISIYVFQKKSNYNGKYEIKKLLSSYSEDKTFDLVNNIKAYFKEVSNSDEFLLSSGVSIFGTEPTLNIESGQNELAYSLLDLVVSSIDNVLNQTTKNSFDIINETFGNFIRDNFRNNIEDAQYMTPSEVVNLACAIVISDLSNEKIKGNLKVCDPCCGVGSFLSTFYNKSKIANGLNDCSIDLIGQDKVSRMVRLSKINLYLFDNLSQNIESGNSLVGNSLIAKYKNDIDIILTNPPFGAKFHSTELRENLEFYPLLGDLISKNDLSISSEILFVDRCISLLKPGGKLLAVLPDSIISSSANNSKLRNKIINSEFIRIKAIIGLPVETFAQAGTRTKTSLLYLEKIKKSSKSKKYQTFMSEAKSIGFDVSVKKGSTVKVSKGVNELVEIEEVYKKNYGFKDDVKSNLILNNNPSCVLIDEDDLMFKSWTPSHYNSLKINIINNLESNKKFDTFKLSELVNFDTSLRRKTKISNKAKCISVLHVQDDDNLDLDGVLNYNPKYKGISCKPGDLLFSKINPRIMRFLIVPDLNLELSCSSEFEILNSKVELSNYLIKLLLMNPKVQSQINTTTSGTSSSHNRIKSNDLANIIVPIPRKNSKLYDNFMKFGNQYEENNLNYMNNKLKMEKVKNQVFSLIN